MRQLKREKLEAHYAEIDDLYEKEPEAWSSIPIEDMKGMYEAKLLGVTEPLIRLKNFLNDEYTWSIDESSKGALKSEILGDLLPILDPADDAEIGRALEKLVDKINDMHLYSPWQVSERSAHKTDAELAKIIGDSDLFSDGPELHTLGRVLKLGRGRFVVHNKYDFDLDAPATDRQGFYSIITRALTDGTFHKLKKCRECPSFFIADRVTDKFCRPECSRAFFSRDAINRVRQSRAKHAGESKKYRRAKRTGKRRSRKHKHL